jgi:hypothetical protein
MQRVQSGLRSTKSKRSPLGNVISKEFGAVPTLKDTPASSNARVSDPRPKKTFFGPTCKISAVTPDSFSIELPVVSTTRLRAVRLSHQLRSIANASSDELMFLTCLGELGPDSAQRLAVVHHWNTERLVGMLRPAMPSCGRDSSRMGGNQQSKRRAVNRTDRSSPTH